MTEHLLPCVETGCLEDARASVIWLHGLGADGNDFVPIVPLLKVPEEERVRFVFPHAPRIPVTVNGGMVMPAWFDIRALDGDRNEDPEGIEQSSDQIRALIEREHDRGVPSERIVLAGFSQGGAVALHLGLRFEERLAGIMALSTYLAGDAQLEEERSAANADIPILQAHGTLDPMVPYSMGKESCERLTSLGYQVDWREYPMAHQVCDEEISHIGAWLRTVLFS